VTATTARCTVTCAARARWTDPSGADDLIRDKEHPLVGPDKVPRRLAKDGAPAILHSAPEAFVISFNNWPRAAPEEPRRDFASP